MGGTRDSRHGRCCSSRSRSSSSSRTALPVSSTAPATTSRSSSSMGRCPGRLLLAVLFVLCVACTAAQTAADEAVPQQQQQTTNSSTTTNTTTTAADTQRYYEETDWGAGHQHYSNDPHPHDPAAASALPACPPGQGRPSASEPCQLCPYGRFNPGGVRGPCLRCPAGTVTIAPGATECGCRPGTGTSVLSEAPCLPCANGTYAPGGSMSPCLRCPGSAYMVTPPNATRVSQCTCKPGFGSTQDFPLSCQMCPIGTYANALAEIIDIPGVPPQGGKGITRGLTGATIKRCIPCCPSGVGTCGLSTRRAGAQSYSDCFLVQPLSRPYCCGGGDCPIRVPEPPSVLPPAAQAAAEAAAVQPDFQTVFAGATVTFIVGGNVLNADGSPFDDSGSDPEAPPPHREKLPGEKWAGNGGGWGGGGSWDGSGSSNSDSGGWRSSGSSVGGSNSWRGSGDSSDSDSSGSSWGGSARSRGWGSEAAISGAVIDQDHMVTIPAGMASALGIVADSSSDGSSSEGGSISSTEPAQWSDAEPPGELQPSTVCSANPRVAEPNLVGLAANTPWIISGWADLTPGTSCTWTASNLAGTFSTGSQIAPNLVLASAQSTDYVYLRTLPAFSRCSGLVLVNVQLCYSFVRQQGNFLCQGVNAIGASWNNYTLAGPNDQAIIFLGSTRPGPYYQYNYIENLPTASAADTFQSLSYSGDGQAATSTSAGFCGCAVCPNMPCGLGRSGPAPGPLKPDERAPSNGAVNANLETCGGGGFGSCMTINGQSCCLAVASYQRVPDGSPACTSLCTNFWSSISASKPLANLWANVMWRLPRTTA